VDGVLLFAQGPKNAPPPKQQLALECRSSVTELMVRASPRNTDKITHDLIPNLQSRESGSIEQVLTGIQ
jgi:hypothetical protein